jgi:uncharacterized protein (TIGR02246 family)
MCKACCVVSILLLGIAHPAPVHGQDPADAAIRQVVKRYEAAYNRGDADAVATIYAQDASHTYAMGITHHGRVEIAQGLREMLAGPLRGTQIALNPLRIRSLSSDIAVEEAAFTLAGLTGPDGTAMPPVAGFCMAVYQRRAEEWLAAAVQCMVPPPMP